MERNGRDVESFGKIVVIQIIVRTLLTDIQAHANGMQHEIDFSSQEALAFREYFLEIFDACGVSRDDRRIELFGKSIEFAHAKCNRGIREGDRSTFFHGLDRNFPCNGMFIERTEDNSALAFQ